MKPKGIVYFFVEQKYSLSCRDLDRKIDTTIIWHQSSHLTLGEKRKKCVSQNIKLLSLHANHKKGKNLSSIYCLSGNIGAYAQVLTYLCLTFLPPLQYSGSEWNFICGAQNIERHVNNSTANISFHCVQSSEGQFFWEGHSNLGELIHYVLSSTRCRQVSVIVVWKVQRKRAPK